jgi:hypothetical protein
VIIEFAGLLGSGKGLACQSSAESLRNHGQPAGMPCPASEVAGRVA